MPSPTVDQLKQRETSIKKALAGLGEAPDQAKHRALRKKLKRTQRRRRIEITLAAQHAPKPKAEAKSEAPKEAPAAKSAEAAAAPEAPAEETKKNNLVLGRWRRLRSRRLQDCRVFEVDEVDYERPEGGSAHPFYRIRCADWINVIPLTEDGEVLLLRQYRFGVEEFTVEIPGGMCDPGESPRQAAARELLEETGYEASEWTELGWVHPNPAIQDNRCHSFLAQGLVHRGEPRPDGFEAFEQLRAPLTEIPRLMRERKITHSLVVAAFHLFDTRAR